MDISKYTDEGCVADIYVEGSSSNGDSQDDETEGEESEYEQGTNEGSKEGSDEGSEEGSDELEEDEVDIDLGVWCRTSCHQRIKCPSPKAS